MDSISQLMSVDESTIEFALDNIEKTHGMEGRNQLQAHLDDYQKKFDEDLVPALELHMLMYLVSLAEGELNLKNYMKEHGQLSNILYVFEDGTQLSANKIMNDEDDIEMFVLYMSLIQQIAMDAQRAHLQHLQELKRQSINQVIGSLMTNLL